MKKSLQKLFSVLFVLTGVLAFSACSSDDDGPKSYPVKVNLTFADTLSFDDIGRISGTVPVDMRPVYMSDLYDYKTKEDVIKLNHYSNLQLLKAEDNLHKGAKLDWRLDDVK